MPVPNTFGTATSAIPLSDLDDNFAAPITIGNTAVQLGNTVTTLNNMTLANVTISSGNVTITNVGITNANVSGTANISTLVVVGNATVGGNTTITGNITAANANVTTNLVLSNGTANGVAYLNDSKVLTTGSALTFNGSNLSVVGTYAINQTNLFEINNGQSGATKFASGVSLTSDSGGNYTSAFYVASGSNTRYNLITGTPTDLLFYSANTEAIRLTSTSLYTASTINVGIGLSNPTAKLQVFKGASGAGTIADSALALQYDATTTYGRHFMDGNGFYQIYAPSGGVSGGNLSLWATNSIQFRTAGVAADPAKMTLDASGNLGLGVTPSGWNTSQWTALEGAYGGALAFYKASNVPVTVLTSNAYNDGGWKYQRADPALQYEMDGNGGTYKWYQAASGANANDPITFTQAMTLDASGNLLVGQTSKSQATVGFYAAENGEVSGCLAASTNSATQWNTYSTGAGAYRFYVGMGGTIFATSIVITAISDERLKENVRDIDTGLSSIMALKPRRFDWKEGKGQDKKNAAGFIAQEFEDVFPECVSTSKAGEDGIEYKNINHETLIPTLVKAIQELKAEFDAYKASHP
jgi:hypothetical protein